MKPKTVLIIFSLALMGLLLLVGMRSQPVQADMPSTAPVESATFLPVVMQQEPQKTGWLVLLRPGSGRLLSFATTSWDAARVGGDLTYSNEAFVFDLVATESLPPAPSPDLYFLSRLYLEFELPAELPEEVGWVHLRLPVCETPNSPVEEPVGFTVHQGNWSRPLNQENSAAIWSNWSPAIWAAQTEVALDDELSLSLPLAILPTDENTPVRLVLRVLDEENHPETIGRTCFDQERVALELFPLLEN